MSSAEAAGSFLGGLGITWPGVALGFLLGILYCLWVLIDPSWFTDKFFMREMTKKRKDVRIMSHLKVAARFLQKARASRSTGDSTALRASEGYVIAALEELMKHLEESEAPEDVQKCKTCGFRRRVHDKLDHRFDPGEDESKENAQ